MIVKAQITIVEVYGRRRTIPKPKDERLLLLYRVLCRELTDDNARAGEYQNTPSTEKQHWEYRFGRSLKSMSKFIVPIHLKLKTRLGRANHWVHAQFKRQPGSVEMALYERQEQAVHSAFAALSPILGPVIQPVAQDQTKASASVTEE